MNSFLSIPVTNHTYEDCCLMTLAKKLKLPMESGLIEYRNIHKELE